MTSGYMPGGMPDKGEPGFDQILRALREGLKENPRLKEMPAEEVANWSWADTWKGSPPHLSSRRPLRAWRPRSRVSRTTNSRPRRPTPHEQ
jgi:hypothetical protein